jgi:hypothetical protein
MMALLHASQENATQLETGWDVAYTSDAFYQNLVSLPRSQTENSIETKLTLHAKLYLQSLRRINPLTAFNKQS